MSAGAALLERLASHPLQAAFRLRAGDADEFVEELIAALREAGSDALEIHAMRRHGEGPNDAEQLFERDGQRPDAWTVFHHLRAGGIDTIGDFPGHAGAEDLALRLSAALAIPVDDYSVER